MVHFGTEQVPLPGFSALYIASGRYSKVKAFIALLSKKMLLYLKEAFSEELFVNLFENDYQKHTSFSLVKFCMKIPKLIPRSSP